MKKIIFIIIIFIVSLFLYGRYIEVNNFKINEYTIKNENVPDSFENLKIVHFSDLLYISNTENKYLEDLVKNINNEKPDILIFSGDLFNNSQNYSTNDYDDLKSALKKMNASLYKFAVIGDNDKNELDIYKDILYESNFKLLDNENMLFFYKDVTPINIIGLSNLDNIDQLLKTDVEYNYSLAIIHEPDLITNISKYNINTVFSGHSLGGVVNLPFYGGLIKRKGALTYINSYYTLNNTEIFISNGLGHDKHNFRLFNSPSINVYRFQK